MAPWKIDPSVDKWWKSVALGRGKEREVVASMIMIISKEHNTRVFLTPIFSHSRGDCEH
jgi:hypothetical protein